MGQKKKRAGIHIKAVLEFPSPPSCEWCRLLSKDEDNPYEFCAGTVDGFYLKGFDKKEGRADFCPLKFKKIERVGDGQEAT